MCPLSSILSTRKPAETGACAPPAYLTAEHERKRTLATYKFTLAHHRWKALEVPQRRRHHVDTHRHKTHRTPAARAPLSAWLKRDRDDSRDRVRGARCIQIETSWTLSSSVLLMLSGRWNRDGEEFCVMNTNEWTTPTSGLWITITDALTWSLRASMAKHANNKQAPLSKNLNKAILHYIAIEIFKKKSFFHCLKPTPY